MIGAAAGVAVEAALGADLPGLTEGTLLGGRVRYAQWPKPAFRSGVEPVLLAASVPAHRGERVLEAGCGAGAAILCLASRTGAGGIALDLDPAACAAARHNALANAGANAAGVLVVRGDVAGLPAAGADHAFANPPYHGAGTPSPHPGREAAKRGAPGAVAAWCALLLRAVRPGGTASVILPAGCLDAALAGFSGAGTTVVPIWPRAGQPARFVIVRAVRGERTALRLRPGLILHAADGRFTPEAEAVLSGGAALD